MKLNSYNCGNCGASVDFAAEQISAVCAFCTSPVVIVPSEESEFKPELVAPFVIDQKVALQKLSTHLLNSWLAPNELRKAATPEGLKAVLLPFFVFNATARSQYHGDIGINWTEHYTETVTDANGNRRTVHKTRVHTEWFQLSGTHLFEYRQHLVCGSEGVSEESTNDIEPFDIGKASPFDPRLLAGVLAERFKVDKDTAVSTCHQEIQSLEGAEINRYLPGDKSRNVSFSTQIDIKGVRTILLPIYIASYTFKGETLQLLVNGQSGSVGGPIPKSLMKIIVLVLAILVALMGLVAVIGVTS